MTHIAPVLAISVAAIGTTGAGAAAGRAAGRKDGDEGHPEGHVDA